MDFFSFVTLIGGLAFFLYGMHMLSAGLEKLAGGKLEQTLKKMTSNRFAGLALGTGITVAIQSSSAVTVMLVGLVNSGIMELHQTVPVIMGSNIGTTMTAWLLSLAGLESGNFFVKILKPENFSMIFAFIGILLIMMAKSQKKKDVGGVLIGFAVLMYGMKLMSGAVSPLADSPEFASLLVAFKNPLVGVVAGALFTGIIQSSSASVGVLQAFAQTGTISYGVAIPIIMGQNIGTCITALISSIGVSRNARKVSIVHVSFNLIGAAVCLTLFYLANAIFRFAFVSMPIDMIGIAVVHSVFNVFTTMMLLPFVKGLEKIANLLLPDKHAEKKREGVDEIFIDTRLLSTPSVAISECNNRTVEMAHLAKDTLHYASNILRSYQQDTADQILKNEDRLDLYEDKLGTFLVRVSSKAVSMEDSRKISKMLHAIGDFERLGDHAVNLLKTSRELTDKGIHFTDQANAELDVLVTAIRDILDLTVKVYETGDLILAGKVEPLEQVIDRLISEIKSRHIERLRAGNCTIELGFILSDILTNYERISDHCSNIAVAMIEVEHGTFDTHRYLTGVKYGNVRFDEEFEAFSTKYRI